MIRTIFLSITLGLFISQAAVSQIVYPDESKQDTSAVKDTLAVTDTTVVKDTLAHLQEKPEDASSDVIIKHDKERLYVDVKKIYMNDLYYTLPGDSKIRKMDQRLVHKIIYATGKIEIVNETPPEIRNVGDWKKVKVTYEKTDVEGLMEVTHLKAVAEGSSRGFSTPKSLERSAIIILKRKAALVNAPIVLVTDKKTHVAFGEAPSTTLMGIAYSYK